MSWISAKDRLPKKGKSVLTLGYCTSNICPEKDPVVVNVQSVGIYDKKKKKWFVEADYNPTWGKPYYKSHVTHWMELLDPPKSRKGT